ncbi:DNA repair protein complementing XP-C cells homolog [Asterias rubens]|uniref:DNA repair protein complementing XP-C cells homolog n=1 Tax=Asterias rubens TaxID=7604 RepID=UPI00145562C6|nr:DNA repair protein complementing XP-C cells homolog [Asterias rubens]
MEVAGEHDCESEDSYQENTVQTPPQSRRITRNQSKLLQSSASGKLDCHLLTGVNSKGFGESERKGGNRPHAQSKTLNSNDSKNTKERKRTKNGYVHQPAKKLIRKNEPINVALRMKTCSETLLDQSDRQNVDEKNDPSVQDCAVRESGPNRASKPSRMCQSSTRTGSTNQSHSVRKTDIGKESSTLPGSLLSCNAESPNNQSVQCISNKLSLKMKSKIQNSAGVLDSKNSNTSANLTNFVCKNTYTNQTQMEKDEESTSDGESEEWEEVEDLNIEEVECELTTKKPHSGPTQSVEIQIDVPGSSNVRRVHGKCQWAKHVQWQVNRYNKALQLQKHKAHLVCLLASAVHSNEVCNNEELQALALSQVSINQVFGKLSLFNLNWVTQFIAWFKKSYKVDSKNSSDTNGTLTDTLSHSIVNLTASHERNIVLICLITLRALGLETRLVLSLQPEPIKHKTLSKVSSRHVSNKRQSCRSKISGSDVTHEGVAARVNVVKKKQVTNKGKCKVLRKQNRKSAAKMDSDSDFEGDAVSSSFQRKTFKRKILSSESEHETDSPCINSEKIKKNEIDIWIEVFNSEEQKWICLDCIGGHVNQAELCEENATKPMTYVIALDNDCGVKDVTKRYASKWMFETSKLRVESGWWEDTLKPYINTKCTFRDQLEDTQLCKQLEGKPLPTRVSEYKNHHLFVLKRHLLKFEALYPDTANILGYCRGEPVYSRDCVHNLHTRETWLKEGLAIKPCEQPYKTVQGRQRKKNSIDPVLPLYGKWQTELYIPPPAKDGKVPRNEYGNVELFQPSMLPMGTVHLHVPGLNRTARKLGIDCVPAMVGWDYHSGFCHPVLDGYIVCTEFQDVLLDAWEKDQIEIEAKRKERIETRAVKNWKRLFTGILIRKRLNKRFKVDTDHSFDE